jgi:Putative DNA-binding domain
MKLAQLQATFQAHMLRGEDGIEDEIVGDERNPVPRRLGVYSAAYVGRLVDVLGETFPAVHLALGPKLFRRCSGDFVQRHPSRFRSARAYGEELAPWLAAHLRGPRAQGLADLARFEWAVADAFDAANAVALAPGSLAGIDPADWPRLQFTFSPTLQRLNVTSNAVAWWKFACAAQPRPSRWRPTCTQHWLVWRQDLAVCYRRLSQTETQALDAARAGSCFGELCARLSSNQAARLLHDWFTAGLIVKIALRTAASGA